MQAAGQDDEVVAELDVVLSKQLKEHIMLLQFPLRPKEKPYDQAHSNGPTAARFKARAQLLELEVPLDTAAPTYDSVKGHEIGATHTSLPPLPFGTAPSSTGQPGASSSTPAAGGPMRSHVLASTVVPAKTHYAVGVVRDGRLHLTPIKSVLQMRPSVRHMDALTAPAKATDSDESDEEGKDEGEDEPREVQVQFKRRESEKAQAARKKSHAYLQKQVNDEPWVYLQYIDQAVRDVSSFLALFNTATASQTDQANQIFGLLFAEQREPVNLHSTPHDFLTSIVPPSNDRMLKGGASVSPFALLSLHDLRQRPLEEQLRSILLNARTVRHSSFRTMLPSVSDEEMLPILERLALLVQGVWIVNSDLLHAGRIATARDYLLCLFSSDPLVRYGDFSSVAALADETVRQLLQDVAVFSEAEHGWRIRIPADLDFMAQYPDVVQRQQELIRGMFVQLPRRLAETRSGSKGGLGEGAPAPVLASASATGLAAASAAAAQKRREREATAQQPVPALVPNLKLEDIAASSSGLPHLAALRGKTSEEQILSLLSLLFGRFGVLSWDTVEQQVALRAAAVDVSDNLVAKESGMPSAERLRELLLSIALPLQDVFVLKSLRSPQLDEVRDLAIELFRARREIKKADLQILVKERLDRQLQQAAYQKVMKELAFSRGNQWALKSGDLSQQLQFDQ